MQNKCVWWYDANTRLYLFPIYQVKEQDLLKMKEKVWIIIFVGIVFHHMDMICCSRSFFPDPGFQIDKHKKYLLINFQKLGLANRLRSLADWYSVARLVKRHLIISWRPTPDCNIKFEELFESTPLHLTVLASPLPLDGDATLLYVDDAMKKMNISTFIVYGSMEHILWTEDAGSFRLSSDFASLPHTLVATSYDGIIAYEQAPCQHYTLKHSETLQMLKPRSQYVEVVDGLLDQYFSNQIMVAVHVRVHDPVQDWEVVPPGSGEQYAGRFGDGANIYDFLEAMHLIHKHFDCHQSGSNYCPVRFFVASNGFQEKQMILSQYPDAVSINCDLSRDTSDGIQCAFIEWLVISRAGLIIHTYGSSFAEEAAQVHARPLLSIWHKKLVHHRNIFLPFCGQMQFAKYFSKHTVHHTFTEGTFDRRQVSLLV